MITLLKLWIWDSLVQCESQIEIGTQSIAGRNQSIWKWWIMICVNVNGNIWGQTISRKKMKFRQFSSSLNHPLNIKIVNNFDNWDHPGKISSFCHPSNFDPICEKLNSDWPIARLGIQESERHWVWNQNRLSRGLVSSQTWNWEREHSKQSKIYSIRLSVALRIASLKSPDPMNMSFLYKLLKEWLLTKVRKRKRSPNAKRTLAIYSSSLPTHYPIRPGAAAVKFAHTSYRAQLERGRFVETERFWQTEIKIPSQKIAIKKLALFSLNWTPTFCSRQICPSAVTSQVATWSHQENEMMEHGLCRHSEWYEYTRGNCGREVFGKISIENERKKYHWSQPYAELYLVM
jgi:hypothetical protein